uniref:Uncharacterized protein n=3 Tax=Clytia hemisphaerica TaxID=252671 RepID=A0A7M5U059_9CNID
MVLSKFVKVKASVRRPQLNFVRLLASDGYQDVTLRCFRPLYNIKNFSFVGHNKIEINGRDRTQVKIIANSCRRANKRRLGRITFRIFTDGNLNLFPIKDVRIRYEAIDAIQFGDACFA